MSEKMKRLRRTNNPMDRNTRNDLNYNWDVLDKTLSNIESSDHKINERFTEVHNELDDLKLKDKDLDQKIKDNRDTLDAMDADLILEMAQLAEQKGNTAKAQGNKTEEQGNTAKKQGDTAQSKGNKAQTQGNKAEEQGNYAEEQGKYANEKAEYAAEKTSEIVEANADLKKVKLDTVEATSKANTAATKADTATENADKATAISKAVTENAKEQANFANEQGDYAKEQGDRVDELVTNSVHRGTWSSANNYKKFQEVIHEGSTYRAKKDHRDIKPPNTSVWQLVASKGMDGKGTVNSVNGKKPTAEGDVDLGKIVNSVASIAPDASGDVPLTIGDLSTDSFISPNTPPKEYPLGVTTFRGNQAQSKEWQDLVGDGIVNTRVLVVTYKASNVWQATQTIYLIDGFGNTGNTIQHRAIYVRSTMASTIEERNKWSDPVKVLSSHDLSDSTTSDSSDKIATSKAVKYLNDALIGTDDNLRGLQSHFYYSDNEVSSYSTSWGEKNASKNLGSTAFGGNNLANGLYSTAWGYNTLADEVGSTAWGFDTKAEGGFTTAFGHGTVANQISSTSMGEYNKTQKTGELLTIGNGSENTQSNALRLDNQGNLFVAGNYHTTGADYAEYFEWEDGNLSNEDRVGLFVAFSDGEKIKLAEQGDEILGIVSSSAAIVGDSYEDDWKNKYITDSFGRIITEEVEVVTVDGKIFTRRYPKLNPYYDNQEEYIPRSERREWDTIGLMGKLYVIDDGSCEVNGYATVDKNGVATKSMEANNCRVVKRISKNVDGKSGIIKVMFK